MSDTEAGMAAEGGGTQGEMGGQTGTQLTVSGTFTSGLDASLDMSGIDDMGGDEQVDIYASQGMDPTARQTGPNNRRGNYAPAPASFPTNLNGGAWRTNTNYWVQVSSTNGNTTTTWEGSITAPSAGTHNITLNQQTF